MTLKPCPFDGAPAKMMRHDPGMDIAPPRYFVQCTRCPVSTAAVSTADWAPGRGYVDIWNAEQLAADVWNTRA